METSLKGRVAVVTGAAGGIGSVLVKELEKRGVICVLVERRVDPLKKLACLLNHKGISTSFEKIR